MSGNPFAREMHANSRNRKALTIHVIPLGPENIPGQKMRCRVRAPLLQRHS